MAVCSIAQAAETAHDSLKYKSMETGGISPLVYLKIILLLALVIAFILGTVWLIKRFAPQFNRRGMGSGNIKIISSTWLGPKRALFLVEVIDRVILLGMTENNINALAEFTDQQTIESLKKKINEPQSAMSFSSILSTFLKKRREE